MALAALDKAYSDEIRAMDKRIEETLQEIDAFLKNGYRKNPQTNRASSMGLDNQSKQERINVIRVSLQKILHFCHEQPQSTEVAFTLLKALAVQESLPLFQIAVDCTVCVQRGKERDESTTNQIFHTRPTNPLSFDETESIIEDGDYELQSHESQRRNSLRRQKSSQNHTPSFAPGTPEDAKSLWRCICCHVSDYIFGQLTSSPAFLSLTDSLVKKSKWESYFEILRSFFVPTQVRRIHHKVRTEQLRNFSCLCKTTCLSCLCEFCVQGLMEDVSFLCVGHFRPTVVTWQELQEPYVTRVREHITGLLREFHSPLGTVEEEEQKIPKLLLCLADPECCLRGTADGLVEKSSRKCEKVNGNTSRGVAGKEGRQQASPVSEKSRTCQTDFVTSKADVSHWRTLAILGLVEELQWFDQQVGCVFNIDAYGTNGDIGGHPFFVASDSPEEHESDEDGNSDTCSWDWRGLLASNGILTSLQRSIQRDILTEKGSSSLNNSEGTTLADVDGTTVKVTVLAFQAVEHLGRYCRAASASRTALSPFKASFSHAVHLMIGDALKHVEALLAREHNIPQALYVALNTALYLAENVTSFSAALTGAGKSPSSNLHTTDSQLQGIQQRVATVTSLAQKQIVVHHLKWLSGCLAQDAESHDWSGRGVFQEGKRISFTVQAWNLYMQGLKSDFCRELCPTQGRGLLAEILSETLAQESHRYARVQPSEGRLAQFTADIVTLLLCTYEALFTISTTTSELMGTRNSNADLEQGDKKAAHIEAIHGHCTILLATLGIVASPLEAVYRLFKSGFPEASSHQEKPVYSPWLAWVRPGLFQWPPWARLLPAVAIWLPMTLCLEADHPDALLIVRLLTAENCTLSTMVTSEMAVQSALVDAGEKRHFQRFLDALLRIMEHCDHLEHSFSDILLSIIEKLDDWRHFDSSALTKAALDRPWWLQPLQGRLEVYLESVVASVASPLLRLSCENSQQWIKEAEHEITQLTNSTLSDKCTDAACLADLLSCTMAVIPTLPAPLLSCLMRLDVVVRQAGVQSAHDSPGLQVVFSVLYDILKSESRLCKLFGVELETRVTQKCSDLADDLVAATNFTSDPASSTKSLAPRRPHKVVVARLDAIRALFRANRQEF